MTGIIGFDGAPVSRSSVKACLFFRSGFGWLCEKNNTEERSMHYGFNGRNRVTGWGKLSGACMLNEMREMR